MEIFNVLTFAVCLVIVIQTNSSPLPGHHHHVHHRIIVPQRIKTIYHTKIVKVPEHHHYFHEKEKIIQLETSHHKDDHKTEHKDVRYPPLDNDDFDDFSDFHPGDHHYSGARHNIFKKHAIVPKNRKRTRVQRKKEKDDEEE